MTDTLPRVHWSVTRHRYETHCPDCGSVVWEHSTYGIARRLAAHQRHECPERAR